MKSDDIIGLYVRPNCLHLEWFGCPMEERPIYKVTNFKRVGLNSGFYGVSIKAKSKEEVWLADDISELWDYFEKVDKPTKSSKKGTDKSTEKPTKRKVQFCVTIDEPTTCRKCQFCDTKEKAICRLTGKNVTSIKRKRACSCPLKVVE